MTGRNDRVTAWFGRLSDVQRSLLVRETLASVDRLDPGWVTAMACWRKGKTVRFLADVPDWDGQREIAIHLKLPPDDTWLHETLRRRAGRGDLEFVEGQARADQGAYPAWVAPLGMGTVSFFVRDGELMVVGVTAQAVVMPTGFAVGHKLPFGAPNGIVSKLYEGQMNCIFGFAAPDLREIATFMQAPVRFGLARVTAGCSLICLSMPGVVVGWSDMPFSMAIEPPPGRHLIPLDGNQDMSLALVLVDTRTAIVCAMRIVHVPPPWSTRFCDIVEEQAQLPRYSKEDYLADVAMAHRKWEDSASLAGDIESIADIVE